MDGKYRYLAYHNSSDPVVVGSLHIVTNEDGSITGTWKLTRTGTQPTLEVGPQVGSGRLWIEIDRSARIIMRTTMIADFEVIMVGTKENDKVRGEWQYRNDTGTVATGEFTAVPEQ